MTIGARPKISDLGFAISDFQKSAVACATRATFANVKSSAMTARQPSVPNLICVMPRVLKRNGAPGGIRTHDQLIKSQLLYQLSYRGNRLDLIEDYCLITSSDLTILY